MNATMMTNTPGGKTRRISSQAAAAALAGIRAGRAIALTATAMVAVNAYAGAGGAGGISAAMTKGQTILTDVSSGLTALGLIVVTIAVMFVGYRMLFGGAHWKDLAPIFWGGLLIGGAATVAGALLG